MSPLAEGRELKLGGVGAAILGDSSPLAEGRELKYYIVRYSTNCVTVAPRGGA